MKKNLVFLPVPDYFNDLFIDPNIPIPAEVPEGEDVNLDDLSIETILLAMLRVIEENQVEKDWIDYYCNFILKVRPDIITMLEINDDFLNDKRYKNAHSLVTEGRAQEALSSIKSFLEHYPNIWNGWFILGWALRLLGRWKDGEAALRKTIELGGANSDIRNELAICLMEMDDLKNAKTELETALRNDPENTKIISNLGVLALKNGEKEKAAGFFRTVLEIDKDDPVAKKLLVDSF